MTKVMQAANQVLHRRRPHHGFSGHYASPAAAAGELYRYTSKMPVPDEIDVYYDERKPPIRCRSLREVDATLDKLHREADPARDPVAVAIKVFGHEIDIGLGADPTFLCLQIEPCDGEYYLAVENSPKAKRGGSRGLAKTAIGSRRT